MFTLYGIANCNTVKKAQLFLDNNHVSYTFINFKKEPPKISQITNWKKSYGDWPVNKKGPTYRKIKEEFEAASSQDKKKVLIENSSAIKRPILQKGDEILAFGFDEEQYSSIFKL